MIIYYTDLHDVDEDRRTISDQGSWPSAESKAGIMDRYMDCDPYYTTNIVASYVREHHLLHPDGYHNVGRKIPTDQSIHMYPYLYKFS